MEVRLIPSLLITFKNRALKNTHNAFHLQLPLTKELAIVLNQHCG